MSETITLTKTNFGSRIWLLYDMLMGWKSLKIEIDTDCLKQEKTNKNKEHKTHKEAMEDYKNWVNVISHEDYMLKRWLTK